MHVHLLHKLPFLNIHLQTTHVRPPRKQIKPHLRLSNTHLLWNGNILIEPNLRGLPPVVPIIRTPCRARGRRIEPSRPFFFKTYDPATKRYRGDAIPYAVGFVLVSARLRGVGDGRDI